MSFETTAQKGSARLHRQHSQKNTSCLGGAGALGRVGGGGGGCAHAACCQTPQASPWHCSTAPEPGRSGPLVAHRQRISVLSLDVALEAASAAAESAATAAAELTGPAAAPGLPDVNIVLLGPAAAAAGELGLAVAGGRLTDCGMASLINGALGPASLEAR